MPGLARMSDPGTSWAVPDPEQLALRIRLRAVQMVAPLGFGYLGQALSSAEEVAALFAAPAGVLANSCIPSSMSSMILGEARS
jgi:transketolase N-terminal domain/subunit